ncbi:hypothetical protein SAMN04488020_103188 [Palleronia marisminoris]|uniref:O-antigen ligase-related domain-containing protein n=1 Tax=Palleronia marisminoris TaxID=315423 RepID=A0A1Y5S8R2_9RHOB|nr:O-antigen ligase family protein [Palleronia marisminoris]SFG68561.1 hypothetical protein SAMN04488020_103188 [Palleronia marisminoris]SLN35051.1 hypothetical protein PAM7066_01468 [Palleronia marisminoris]
MTALPNAATGRLSHDRASGVDMWLITALVFLSPFNVLRLPGVFFTAADILTVAVFLYLLLSLRLSFTPFGRFTPIWYAGTAMLLGGLLIGSIAHYRLVTGGEVIAQYFFALVILPIAIARRSREEARWLLLVFAVSITLVMLHGVYLMNFATNPPPNFVSGSGRLRSVLERSNETAAIGATALLVVLYLGAVRILPGVVAVLFSCVLLYGVTMTASNTGVMAAAAGTAAFTLLQASRRHLVNLCLLVAIACGAFAIKGDSFLSDRFVERVGGALTSVDIERAGTFNDRVDLTRQGWRETGNHLVIGLGAEGFRTISSHRQPVHNTFVLLLVEGGLLSFGGLVTLIGGTFALGISLSVDRRFRTIGALVVAVSLVFAFFMNAFAHVFARFWIVPLVLVLALAVSEIDYRERGVALPRKGHGRSKGQMNPPRI